jgi:hypothetical protein
MANLAAALPRSFADVFERRTQLFPHGQGFPSSIFQINCATPTFRRIAILTPPDVGAEVKSNSFEMNYERGSVQHLRSLQIKGEGATIDSIRFALHKW